MPSPIRTDSIQRHWRSWSARMLASWNSMLPASRFTASGACGCYPCGWHSDIDPGAGKQVPNVSVRIWAILRNGQTIIAATAIAPSSAKAERVQEEEVWSLGLVLVIFNCKSCLAISCLSYFRDSTGSSARAKPVRSQNHANHQRNSECNDNRQGRNRDCIAGKEAHGKR